MLARELTILGYEVILPQIEGEKFIVKGKPDIKAICEDCRSRAMTCDVLVANIDGTDADSGTAVEIGLAVATGIPVVICVRTDFRTDMDKEVGVNGMLVIGDIECVYLPAFVNSLSEIPEAYQYLAISIRNADHAGQWKARCRIMGSRVKQGG